ncbi:retrovirus-related pol polyprotein from transposon TNT 1-94 [Tanacetum coccineum]|uniref:Retrovirus-related pol polyprotein from transposon TNT 1-94 n=1 Tax=Tanacetum coccineum TaxID=301880 RepID=A0ABQ5CJV4_9ASTR
MAGVEVPQTLEYRGGQLNAAPVLEDIQDSPDDEEDTRSSHEYLNDLEEEYQARALLAKFKRFFKKVPSYQSPFHSKSLSSPQHKPELRPTKDFKAKYNKVKDKLALLSSSASASKASTVKNKGLIVEAYEWDEEEVSSDDNEMVEVKVLMALAGDNDAVSKEGARNDEWIKISIRKVHTLLEMEDNDDRKTYLDYLCIDLNYVEEQRNNLLSKHRDLILKENKNLRTELKELTTITETWLNSSNKVNQCINEQIPSQKKRVLGVDQLTKDPSSSGQKDLVFVKSSANDTKVSIPGVERPWLSKAKGFILPNHDTGRILPAESQRNTTDPSVAVTDSSVTEYDSADESSVCSTPLPPLKKLNGAEPTSGPKTIKSILKSKFTFKAETLNGAIINEPSSAPVKGNKNYSALVVNSAHAGKLKSVKIKDDPPLAIVPQNALQNKYKTQFKKSCDLCGLNNHLSENCYKVLFCKRCEKTDHRTCDHAEYISTMNMSQHLKSLGRASSRSKIPRPSKRFFPPCTHCGCIDHLSNECLYYPICGLCGSYDHDTNGHNRIISLEREINPRNPQHTFKRCEVCGSSTHTTTDHYDIEWFKRGEALQAKKAEALKSTRAESSNANRSKTPTKSGCSRHMTGVKSYLHKYMEQPGPKVAFGDDSTCTTKGYGSIKCNGIVFTKFNEKEEQSSTQQKSCNDYSKRSVFSKQYWTEAIATACYTQNRSTIVKRHLKTPYEIFCKRIPNINFLHVFRCPVYIHNHKDHLGKFDEKADDGYLFRYSLVSKAFRVFNTRRQQTKETYHITFDESPNAIKFLKPSVDNINIAENKRYPPDEYLHPYEPSQRYQTNSNDVSFIEPYESPEPVVLETEVSSDQNGQTAQTDEIFNHNLSEHSNHNNDEKIIDNLSNTEDIQISGYLSSPNVEDTSVQDTISIPNPPLSIPSVVTLAPQDRWSQDKHIKLVFKNKRDETRIVIKNKERLVAQGYNQQEVIDYDETFALVARLEAIRNFLAFATYMNFIVYQMDVKSAFLNGKLKEVYVKQPPGFESNEFPNHVYKLDKALYGLKQALRALYETLSTFLTEHKFVRGKIDNTLFVYKTQTDVIMVQIYVDDIIFGSNSTKLCKQFAKLMTQRYEISMMGVLTYFLGFQIKQSKRGISINQEKYVKDLLKKYDINGSSVKTPMAPSSNLGPDLSGKDVNETQYRGMIGSLMYLTAYRLDIQFSTCLCARYQANPKESHLIAVKRIFRKSTSGACQLLGGKLVCWSAKKQQSVAMSSAEAEYVATAGCCANILWMKSQLIDYDIIYEKVPIFCDNTSAIAISNNPVLHSRTKHIDIRYHFIRDHILKGDIELHFIPTQYQLADIFTKPLDEPTFKRLIVELGMLNIDSKPKASVLSEEN